MSIQEGRATLNIAGGMVGVGLVFVLGFVTWALIFREVPQPNQNALTLLIGILSANVGMVVGFFFGSSATSKRQAETIDTLAKTAQTAGVALNSTDSAFVIAPGEQATATATSGGTIIEKDKP
jgi:hypothetical protein